MSCVRARYRRAAFVVAAAALCGCELTDITLAEPEDVIVAEVILSTDPEVQTAYLHRTRANNARVPGALVTVHDEDTNRVLQYSEAGDSLCVRGLSGQDTARAGTCYASDYTVNFVRPGGRYSLRIQVGSRVMTGRLQVPGTFRLLRPGPVVSCSLPPRQSLELTWTPSSGAWVYVAVGYFIGLRQALRREGVDVTGTDPVELGGLSISRADTTLILPGEFGPFDRFDADLHPIVLAIQDGLPARVDVALWIGAGDRNYVNWVRGGVFNPSGAVRVPSIQGDGTGVFGALVVEHHFVNVVEEQGPHPCN